MSTGLLLKWYIVIVGVSLMSKHRERHKSKHSHEVESKTKANESLGTALLGSAVLKRYEAKLVKDIKKKGFIPIRVPVIITESQVDIDLENTIELPVVSSKILSVKKNVVLKCCKLIPETNVLFLNGIVMKSIEYNADLNEGSKEISCQRRNVTVKIPFNCTTLVEYIVEPLSSERKETEVVIFKDSIEEKTFLDAYCNADEIFCELVSATFEELNVKNKIELKAGEFELTTFTGIDQKMVMHLVVRLIQNQNVFIQNVFSK